nr:immunoglobulin light chain junction region [Macaca mulatta]MOV86171.1 immunoglobulin light chain junction region [Macaca mulatta]MOV86521.1 immunoglobulin light chain junction region [Macaca mulatta]
CQQYDSDPHTF